RCDDGDRSVDEARTRRAGVEVFSRSADKGHEVSTADRTAGPAANLDEQAYDGYVSRADAKVLLPARQVRHLSRTTRNQIPNHPRRSDTKWPNSKLSRPNKASTTF